MANLITVNKAFTGYKSLTELTGLTFTADTKYVIQVLASGSDYYIREGILGKGFQVFDSKPFEWTYDGENMLYIGDEQGAEINVSE